MNCPACGTANAEGRTFCQSCGANFAPPAPPPTVTAGRDDDVQMIDFARIPIELRAPTAWTIGKGVFVGLLLWSTFSAVVGAVAFAVLVNL